MFEHFGDVAVSTTVLLLCGVVIRHIRWLWQQGNDNQAVDERMQAEDEQHRTFDAEDQSARERVEDQEEKDDDDGGYDSNNAGRPSQGSADGAVTSEPPTADEDRDVHHDAPVSHAFSSLTLAGAITTASDHLREKCGYCFQDGKLVDTVSGKGFIFKGQQDYEELGQVMDEYIYEILERDGDLERRVLGMYDGQPRGFCFASKDVDTNANGMLVLIHGTGVVRAGQWSRRLIINHSLESGSQMPYIQEAKKRNWSVVVMNTNQRNDYYQWINGGAFFMGYDPEEHGTTVWKTIVEGSPAKRIAIVAHSYGGSVTSTLLRVMGGHFKEKVVAIALTDSWCSVQSSDQQYFRKVAKNWVTSKHPVGHSVGYGYDCEHISAGTIVHEETSWKSIGNVFDFIDKRFQASQSNAETVSASQYSNDQETETVEQSVYQQDTRDDLHVHARNAPRAENAADTSLASPAGSIEGNADVVATEQAAGDSSDQSTADCADKNELDNGLEQHVYQQDTRDDVNAHSRNAPRVENAADTPFASPSGNIEGNADAMATEQAAGDSNDQSTANSADKNELDNGAEGSLQPGIDIPDVDACELQQHGASVGGELNYVTNSGVQKEEFCADAALAGDIVPAGERDTDVAGHETEISDTRPFLSELTKGNRDTVAETHPSVADFSNSTTSHPVEGVSLVQNETENQKFGLPAAPVDNEGKGEAAESSDENFDRSIVISDSNVSKNGSSDQSLTEYPLSGSTVSMLSQQPSRESLGDSHLKQSLTEAGGAGSPATCNNTPNSVMATAEPMDESNAKMHAIVESRDIDVPERAIQQPDTVIAEAGESTTDQGSISEDAADSILGQAVTNQSYGKAVGETVKDDGKA